MSAAPNSPTTWIARGISALVHPVFIPFIFFLLASRLNYSSIAEPILAFGILLAAPLVTTLLYLRKMGVSDVFSVDRKNRFIPFAFNIAALVAFAFFIPQQIGNLGYNLELLPWLGSFLVANVVAMIITFWWKISLHMMGIGLATAWLVPFLWETPWFWPVIGALVVLAPLTAWARIHLRSHDIKQVIAGYLAGILIVVGVWGVTQL